MEKIFVLKTGGFYLSKFYLNENNPDTCFIEGLIFTTFIDRALRVDNNNAVRLQKILYIESGVDFEIVEVK